MKALILQHEDSTPPGSTIQWLESRQISWQLIEVPTAKSLPSLQDFDWLFICGGSMNVDQENDHPWLKGEKALIRQAIEQGKKTVGLCLGSQLIAEALGAEVKRQPQTEVGWHPVDLKDGSRLTVFQWHSYGFEIPEGAELTAWGLNHRNQAFSWGSHVVGYQFHPETTRDWALECANSPNLPTLGHVQSASEIQENLDFQPALQSWYFSELDRLNSLAKR